MKRHFFPLFLLVLAGLACNLPFSSGMVPPTVLPVVSSVPTVSLPASAPTPTLPVAAAGGFAVSLSSSLAEGYLLEVVPAVSDENEAGPWSIAPAHLLIRLPNYPLQGKFHEPRLVIYPVSSLIGMNEGAAYNFKRLQEILDAGGGLPASPQDLPGLFFFNAGGLFVSNLSRLSFQNGQGIRWLTQYAQYFAPVNNFELFYLYQGLTQDQNFYVIAVLPVMHPALAMDDNPNAALPPGGIPYPAEDWSQAEEYYRQVRNLLETTPPDSFTPRLSDLDALIVSLNVSPAP